MAYGEPAVRVGRRDLWFGPGGGQQAADATAAPESSGRGVTVNGQFVATYFGAAALVDMGNGGGAVAGRPTENSGGGKRWHSVRHQQRIYGGCRCGGAGGGVGVKGRGSTASGIIYNDGDAVRNGNPGSGGDGVNYGGGDSWPGNKGGDGAVRIIWGIKYSYPDNADVEAEE